MEGLRPVSGSTLNYAGNGERVSVLFLQFQGCGDGSKRKSGESTDLSDEPDEFGRLPGGELK